MSLDVPHHVATHMKLRFRIKEDLQINDDWLVLQPVRFSVFERFFSDPCYLFSYLFFPSTSHVYLCPAHPFMW